MKTKNNKNTTDETIYKIKVDGEVWFYRGAIEAGKSVILMGTSLRHKSSGAGNPMTSKEINCRFFIDSSVDSLQEYPQSIIIAIRSYNMGLEDGGEIGMKNLKREEIPRTPKTYYHYENR